jgi:hypothetical protein
MATHHFLLHERAQPGLPEQRTDRAEIVIEYSAKLMAVENDYHSRGVIAIKVCRDPWFHVSRDEVHEVVSTWLGVPHRDIDVEFFPAKGFLVLLPTSALHDRALSSDVGLAIGQAKLQLLPWTHMAGAEHVKLLFKVHLYIKGVPNHAH